jgi:hypothetical protein
LAGDQSDAAGGRVEQDRLTALQPIRLAQQVLRGEAFEHDGGSRAILDALRQLDEPIGLHDARGTVRAEGAGARRDTVARLHPVDAGTHGLDDARRLVAEPARKRQRIQAAAVIRVDVVDADRRVADARLPGTRLADLRRLELHDLRTTGRVKANCVMHVRTPSRKNRSDQARLRRPRILAFAFPWGS